MLVRLGSKLDFNKFLLADGSIPACFDRKKLMPMHEDVIAWWDLGKIRSKYKDCFFVDYREEA